MSNPTNSFLRNVQLTAPSPLVVAVAGVSACRRRLMFWPPASGSYSVSTDPGVNTGANPGFVLTTTSHPLEISEECHGDLVRRDWYGINQGGSSIYITVLETIGG